MAAGKRRAGYDLNRDNCEDELPKEEAGMWKPAGDDALKGRPILKARRSIANTSQSPASSPFGGFTFGSFGAAKPANTLSVPNFSFGSSPVATNGTANSTTPVSQAKLTSTGNSSSDEGKVPDASPNSEKIQSANEDNSKKEASSEDRLKAIKSKRENLLAEKHRIESELQKLELEEKEIVNTQRKTTNDEKSESSDLIAKHQLLDDDEIELPPEEPWN